MLNNHMEATFSNEIFGSVCDTVRNTTLDSDVQEQYIRSLMEKPLSPNENAVSLVTKYHNQLQEWEEKLGHLTEQISNCQA